ncbi:hypothetical protein ACRRTK_000708 [Alexandromys fortis]
MVVLHSGTYTYLSISTNQGSTAHLPAATESIFAPFSLSSQQLHEGIRNNCVWCLFAKNS